MNSKSVHAGDTGNAETLSGKSIPKNDLRIETLGEMDEVQSILGILRSLIKQKQTQGLLFQIQDDLRLIMGEIASEDSNSSTTNGINDGHLVKLEEAIRIYQEQDELTKGFITPGEDFTSAMVDLGRTIARRAERRVVAAFRAGIIRNQAILKYANRLSTLMYFMEIHEIKLAKNQRPKQNHSV